MYKLQMCQALPAGQMQQHTAEGLAPAAFCCDSLQLAALPHSAWGLLFEMILAATSAALRRYWPK
jgi:hypothetical protein